MSCCAVQRVKLLNNQVEFSHGCVLCSSHRDKPHTKCVLSFNSTSARATSVSENAVENLAAALLDGM